MSDKENIWNFGQIRDPVGNINKTMCRHTSLALNLLEPYVIIYNKIRQDIILSPIYECK